MEGNPLVNAVQALQALDADQVQALMNALGQVQPVVVENNNDGIVEQPNQVAQVELGEIEIQPEVVDNNAIEADDNAANNIQAAVAPTVIPGFEMQMVNQFRSSFTEDKSRLSNLSKPAEVKR